MVEEEAKDTAMAASPPASPPIPSPSSSSSPAMAPAESGPHAETAAFPGAASNGVASEAKNAGSGAGGDGIAIATATATATATAIATESSSSSNSSSKKETKKKKIASAELRSHNTAADLWVAIHGEVYDLTGWLPHHPGGDGVLLSFAGQDITDAFLAFHPAGTGASLLPSLQVGELSDYAPSALSLDYRRAIAELQSSGLFSVKLAPYLPLAGSLAALLLLCVSCVCFCHGTLLHMAAAAGLGLFWSQTSFIMHDYGHSPFLRNPNLDRKLKILLACFLTGLSPSWWKRSHNAHHASTNNLSHDPDVQFIPFFAISSRFFSSLHSHYHGRAMAFGKLSQLLVSHQHLTFYPIMLIARINLLLQAFVFFLHSRDYRGKRMEVCGILSFWLWFSALLWSLPSGLERLGFLLVSCGVTSIQHLQFCLNHFPCEVSDGMPDGAEFLEKQVKGTLNIDCHSSMDWFHGGLQFQLEHHLFPRLPRHNLRRVSAMARALCRRHGLPYVSVGFWRANVMLFQTLRQAAMEARAWKSSSSPQEDALPPKNLAWELINAQG